MRTEGNKPRQYNRKEKAGVHNLSKQLTSGFGAVLALYAASGFPDCCPWN